MRRLRAHDQAKRETAKARNDLEAYIIATRDLVRMRSCCCLLLLQCTIVLAQ